MDTTRNLSRETGQPIPPRQAHCPSCGERAWFTFLGEQRWPEKVAQALGMPTVVEQWLCGACQTTITEAK